MADKTISKARGDDSSPLAISLDNINKTFGSVRANKDVCLSVVQGTIHGIVGENGAGKSTLVSILYGFYSADSGTVAISGEPVRLRSSADAIAAGIGMVHQHFMLVPNFTVLENIILGHEVGSDLKAGARQAEASLKGITERYGLSVDLQAAVQDLPVGLQQRVEILKALYRGARILILDEPTGVLTPQETEQLFDILRTLKTQGVTILLITHKLKEIMAVTDFVSVMRSGQMVDHLQTAQTNPQQLAQMMVGRPVLLDVGYQAAQAGQAMLNAEHLTVTETSGVTSLSDVSFSVHQGEILGIAGVSGNGQSELLEVLAGIRKITSGTVQIGDRKITAEQPASPSEVKGLGLAHVPEDRHAMGLILPFTAAESAVLGYEYADMMGGRSPILSPAVMAAHCKTLMSSYDVRPAEPSLKSNLFSGGNQQKIVLARELSSQPAILLVGQPTRGVDIGAIEFIHKQLFAMRDKGCAVILVSVELDEIMSLSDRVMVMNEGKSMGIVRKADTDIQEIGLMMAGVTAASPRQQKAR